MSVDSAKRVQFVGAAMLGDYAVREHDNLVGAVDGAHSVHDDEHGLSLISREMAVWISVSFSTSRLAAAAARFRLIATTPFRSSSSLAQRLPSIIPRASAFKVL